MTNTLEERVKDVINPLSPLKDNLLSEWLNAAHLVVDLWEEVQRLRSAPPTDTRQYPVDLRD